MDQLLKGIARIQRNGATVGTGFIVSETLLVTCAHVVCPDRGRASGDLLAVFANETDEHVSWDLSVSVRIEEQYLSPADKGDIACLRIIAPEPGIAARALPLGPVTTTEGRPFRTYGFPKLKADVGM